MRKNHLIWALPVLAGVALSATPAFAATLQSGNVVSVDRPAAGDLLLSGSTLTVSVPVAGETFAAGTNVNVNERMGRSGFLAGNAVSVTKGASYDLFAAGSVINLDGEYGNDVYVAGSTVNVLPGAVIHGDLRVFGGQVTMAGHVDGSAFVSADTVSSNVTIGGDLKGAITQLSFTGGSIGGSLHYRSDKEAQGTGQVKVAGSSTRDDLTTPTPAKDTARSSLVFWLVSLVTSLMAGAAFIWLLPRFLDESISSVEAGWAISLARGAAIFFLVPIVSFILVATLVGWPIALVLILAWLLLMVAAWTASFFVIGRFVLQRAMPERAESLGVQLLVGAVIICLLQVLPLLGGLAMFVLFFAVYLPVLGALGGTAFGWARGNR